MIEQTITIGSETRELIRRTKRKMWVKDVKNYFKRVWSVLTNKKVAPRTKKEKFYDFLFENKERIQLLMYHDKPVKIVETDYGTGNITMTRAQLETVIEKKLKSENKMIAELTKKINDLDGKLYGVLKNNK